MVRVGEAEVGGDTFYERPRLTQLSRSSIHFEPHQILIGRLVIKALEQAAEVGAVEALFAGNLLQRVQGPKILLNMMAAFLISRESEGIAPAQWRPGFVYFYPDAFQQPPAELRCLGCAAFASADEFFKERLDFSRRENPGNGARWQV